MSTASIGIGFDSGGGSLKWVVRDGLNLLHQGAFPGANLQLLGWTDFTSRLDEAIREAARLSRIDPTEFRAFGLGSSGLDRPDEVERLRAWLLDKYPSLESIWLGNDALPALRLGAGRLQGVVLVAGTGSIAYGCAGSECRVRVGGWGSLLGDEGGAGWLGLELVKLATRMADGRLAETDLLNHVLDALGLADPWRIIPAIYGLTPAEQRARLSELSVGVFSLASASEPNAARLVERGAAALAELAATAVRELEKKGALDRLERPLKVVCHGGLMDHQPGYREIIAGQLQNLRGDLELIHLIRPAALGSLLLADDPNPSGPAAPITAPHAIEKAPPSVQ